MLCVFVSWQNGAGPQGEEGQPVEAEWLEGLAGEAEPLGVSELGQ